ncbi:MAG: 50S ribosomal protein L23 [Oscillospiraceae bacterium]
MEEIFGVKVAKVNTIRMHGQDKAHRAGIPPAAAPSWKKAMVTLTADSKIHRVLRGYGLIISMKECNANGY